MNEKVKKKCDLIVANRDILKGKMFWEADSNTYAIMAGLLTAANDRLADPDRYQECKKILRKHTGIFSEMRGMAEAVVVTKMTMTAAPEAYVEGVTAVYHKLRRLHKFTASPYMVIAAMNVYEHNGVEGADADIERLELLYRELKGQHPMLVGDADRAFLSMLAASEMDLSAISKRVEDAYDVCRKLSMDKDAVHSMAQILAFSEKTPEENLHFIRDMLEGLNANHTPISKEQGLALLGALALLDIPKEELVTDITEAGHYLKEKNGFKWYNEGTRMRTVYAALAVFLTHAKEKLSIGGMISSNIAVTIAEQIILLTVVLAVSISTAASAGK